MKTVDYVVGLGNYTMGDDAIGLHVVETIVDRKLNQGFEVLSFSHESLSLLSYFREDTHRVLLIDCVDFGGKASDTLLFTPEEVSSEKQLHGLTTHEGDILKVIALAKELGSPIPKIKILGIQPESVAPRLGLSDPLKQRFEHYVGMALEVMLPSW